MNDWDNKGLSLEDIPPEMRRDPELHTLLGLTSPAKDGPNQETDPFEQALSAFSAAKDEPPPFDVMARLKERIGEPAPAPPRALPWWRTLWEKLTQPLFLGPAMALGLLAIVFTPSLKEPAGDAIRYKGDGTSVTLPNPSLEASIDKEGQVQDARRLGALPEGAGLVFQLRPGGGSTLVLLEQTPEGHLQILLRREGLAVEDKGPISPRDDAGRPLAYTPEGPKGIYTYRLVSGSDLPKDTAELWALGEESRPNGPIGVDDLTLHVLGSALDLQE